MIDHSELTGRIIGCAMRVHSAPGPGLLESAYRVSLTHERDQAGVSPWVPAA
jgi:hypothetical protein